MSFGNHLLFSYFCTVMKDKIRSIIDAKSMQPAQFADSIGVQRTTLYHILNGRNNASLDVVRRIIATYPDVDPVWLLSEESSEMPPIYNNGAQTSSAPVQSELFPEQTPENAAENQISRPSVRDFDKYLNPGGVKQPEINAEPSANQSVRTERNIREIIIFYDDGSYRKLS